MFGYKLIIPAFLLSFISSISAKKPCLTQPKYFEFGNKVWPNDTFNIYLTSDGDDCGPLRPVAEIVKLTAIKRFVFCHYISNSKSIV